MKARAPTPSEHASQAAFFQWWELFSRTNGIPTCLCFAVPNGGHRSRAVAGKLKAEGVKRGVCDVMLLIPAGGFHALVMEFKKPGNKVKPGSEQELFISETRRRGYNVLVVWSTEEAVRAVRAYLEDADRQDDRIPRAIRHSPT